MAMSITSMAFENGAGIPARHTCDGENLSPPLTFHEVPEDAETILLIVHDPDAPDPAAPKRDYVHWVLYDVPRSTDGLEEGARGETLPAGALEGLGDHGRPNYTGPCPPIGRHRYFFELFALDTRLGDLHTPDRARITEAMDGHVLERAVLMGTYKRSAKT